MFHCVLIISPPGQISRRKMRTKLLALTLMVMMITSPIAYMAFAEDSSPDELVETTNESSEEENEDTENTETETEDETEDETEEVTEDETEDEDEDETDDAEYETMEDVEDEEGNTVNEEMVTKLKEDAEGWMVFLEPLFESEAPTGPVLQNYMHAQQALTEAEEKTSPEAAAQQYLRAMRQIRNAYRQYMHMNPDAITSDEVETQTTPDEGSPSEEEINAARLELINRFQEQYREQLMTMYQHLDELLSELSPEDAAKLQDAIMRAEQKLLRIQERLDKGEVDEALDELEDATEGLDDDLGGLEDAAAGQMLRTINRIEARIQRLQMKQLRKAAAGEDTTEIDDFIAQMKASIKASKGAWKESHGKGNSGQGNGKSNKGDNGKGKGTYP